MKQINDKLQVSIMMSGGMPLAAAAAAAA